MIFLMLMALIAMGVVLFDTRGRVKGLEARIARMEPRDDIRNRVSKTAPPPAIAPVIAEAPLETAPEPALPVIIPETVAPPPSIAEAVPDLAPEPEQSSEPRQEPSPSTSPVYHQPAAAPRGFGFEDLFGRRLPIWAGGITLAVAGILLIKYSIDSGLLSPAVRIAMGLLFGAGLIASAEVALRQENRLRDPRVRQALSGAGIATLYGAILAAANLYALIGPATAFAGLAIVTALAMLLSLRFGAPSALLGLVGGLAAPALTGSTAPNVPLLACYLALTIGGLCALSRTQRWMWLAVTALIGGAGWTTVLLLTGTLDSSAAISIGALIVAIGIFLPLLAFPGGRATAIRAISVIVGSTQMAILVATGGFAMLHWGLFGLLSVAFIWISGREAGLRRIVPVGPAVALILAAIWPSPAPVQFAVVLAATTLIYGGAACWRLWRPGGSLIEAGQIAGLTIGGLLVAAIHFYHDTALLNARFAWMAVGAAGLPAAMLMRGWRHSGRREDSRFAMLATTSALMLTGAGAIGLAGWTLPIIVAAMAAGLLMLADAAEDQRVEMSGWLFACVSLIPLVAGGNSVSGLTRLYGDGSAADPLHALLRWTALALTAALFAWRAKRDGRRPAAQIAAAILSYGAVAQIVPGVWLAPLAALSLPLLVEAARPLSPHRLLPAMGVMLLILLAWATYPTLEWASEALLSLAGRPMLATRMPDVAIMLRRMALPAGLLAVALWRGEAMIDRNVRSGGVIMASTLGAVSLHILYKQIFHLNTAEAFVRSGLAERTLWEMLLLGCGFAAWQLRRWRMAALVLIGGALAHSLAYSLLLHNPLWATQAVGGLPLINLLIPAFAVPFAALWMIGRIAPELSQRLARPFGMVQMLAIILFAYATLRQLFEGALLNGWRLSAGENIGQSVLAIALAIGFLLWGIRKGARDWRIASLALMLGAVGKVFLFDASGLDGLMRIASFLALGFSLIGIGWLYSRQLGAGRDDGAAA